MHPTTGLPLLRLIDKRLRVSLQRLIAPGRVRVELPARVHRHIGYLLAVLTVQSFPACTTTRP